MTDHFSEGCLEAFHELSLRSARDAVPQKRVNRADYKGGTPAVKFNR